MVNLIGGEGKNKNQDITQEAPEMKRTMMVSFCVSRFLVYHKRRKQKENS